MLTRLFCLAAAVAVLSGSSFAVSGFETSVNDATRGGFMTTELKSQRAMPQRDMVETAWRLPDFGGEFRRARCLHDVDVALNNCLDACKMEKLVRFDKCSSLKPTNSAYAKCLDDSLKREKECNTSCQDVSKSRAALCL